MSKEQNQEYQIDEQMIDNFAQDDVESADAEKLREHLGVVRWRP